MKKGLVFQNCLVRATTYIVAPSLFSQFLIPFCHALIFKRPIQAKILCIDNCLMMTTLTIMCI